jgi:transcriptional regulator with XRE-family HTH domain
MNPNGTALRAVRKSQHVGLRQLARRVGVSHQFLGRLEENRTTASPATMHRLADELSVPLEAVAHPEAVGAQ